MFKVKDKKTGEIIQVLDTYCDEYGDPWFLYWSQDRFIYRSGFNFVPPNYQIEENIK